ncbi:MAG: DNA lyase [Nanoarchaeota archaeon]
MQIPLKKEYEKRKKEIKLRLNQFRNLPKKEYFNEFLFCLLTPQSNAQRCWQAVEQLKKIDLKEAEKVKSILSKKTRFHNTKARRIANSYAEWNKLKPMLEKKDKKQLRNWIAENINGLGYKEASHFLRNIGLSNNKIAILDRHILKNLYNLNLIKETKIKGKKNYLEIENTFLDYAYSIDIPADELDLLFWSLENGEIFK